MTAHLEDRVALWLSTHPGSTVEQIARGVQFRNVAVREVLAGPLFTYSNVGGARLYRVGLKAQDGLGRAESDKQFLLRVLSDGEPHTLNEILRRSFADRGCGLTVHSRASDLRADGYRVENWKNGERGNGSWYRLLGAGSGVAESPLPAPSSRTLDEREPQAGETGKSFPLSPAKAVVSSSRNPAVTEVASRSSSGQAPPELGPTAGTSGRSIDDGVAPVPGAEVVAAENDGQLTFATAEFRKGQVAA